MISIIVKSCIKLDLLSHMVTVYCVHFSYFSLDETDLKTGRHVKCVLVVNPACKD